MIRGTRCSSKIFFPAHVVVKTGMSLTREPDQETNSKQINARRFDVRDCCRRAAANRIREIFVVSCYTLLVDR